MKRGFAIGVAVLLALILLAEGALYAGLRRERLDWSLIVAATSGYPDAVARALAAGADPEVPEAESGMTPLMLAASLGHTESARLLLEHGAEVHARAPGGYTALMAALPREQPELIRLLLDAGADVNAGSEEGVTPLAWAALWGSPELVRMLVEAGADPDAVSADGKTPRALAEEFGREEIRRILESARRGSGGGTPGRTTG